MGVENHEKLKLYLRLPVKIVDEHQVKQLHPNIVAVHLPRQKSRRWCIVDFVSQDALLEAKKQLSKAKINGKKIVIKPYLGKSQQKNKEIVSEKSLEPLLALAKSTSQ